MTSLHIWRWPGTRTQSWLYRMLTGLERYAPTLLVRREWIERERMAEFPWPEEAIRTLPRRNGLAKVLGKVVPFLRTGSVNVLGSWDVGFIQRLCAGRAARSSGADTPAVHSEHSCVPLREAAEAGFDVIHIHFGWTACTVLGAMPRLGAPVVVSFYGKDLFLVDAASGRGHGLASLASLVMGSLRSRHWSWARFARVIGHQSPVIGDQLSEGGGKPTDHRSRITDHSAYARRLKKLLRRQDLCFHVTSRALKERAVALGADPEQVHVIHVGIDCAELPSLDAVAQRLAAPQAGPLRIVTVGRLIEFKAQDRLPTVARRLMDKGVDFHWKIIGDGPLRDGVESQCNALGVHECVELTGSLPFEAVRNILCESDIMVHNAVIDRNGDHESLGVALMEGGAFGLPVVSCRLGGIPEVVRDGETGFLVEPGRLDDMADRIARLAGDPGLRRKMGLAAARHVREAFDSHKLAAELERLYDRLIGDR